MDAGFPRADTPTDTINEQLTCDVNSADVKDLKLEDENKDRESSFKDKIKDKDLDLMSKDEDKDWDLSFKDKDKDKDLGRH